MATTQNLYTGNGSLKNYTFSFPYLEETDIKVSLDGVDTTAYTLANATTVSFNTAPANGAAIRIYRVTNAESPQATFFAGSAIRAQDLNDNFNQVLYNTQENVNRRINKSGDTMDGDLRFAQLANIVMVGTDGAHETTVAAGTPTQDQLLSLPNSTGVLVSTGDVGTVATAMIADSNVTTAKIADANVTTSKIADSNVTTSKIADGNITTAKINDAAVTTVKIADANVTTAKIADSNVVTAKIADSNVTTAKIADSNVTTAKINDSAVVTNKIADANVTTAKIADSNVTTAKIADGNVTTAKIADSNVTTSKINDGAVTNAKVANGTLTSSKLTPETVVTATEHSTATTNDTSFFTTSASDARYFRQDSTETIASGDTWTGSDAFVATTGAIDARIIDLVDDVGGFVPIPNETSFPTSNPDVNDGAGTIVSVAAIATTRTPSSGTVTIANGSGTNTVTITGCGSTALESGYGMLVETTSTLHTYTFHRLVPRATEVTTVAGISAAISTAATNVADINNFADVYQINNGDPTQRADSTALQVGDLVYRSDTKVIRAYNGSTYQNITPDAATLADISVVADDLATFDDLGSITEALTAAQSGGALETCADNIADIRTLADIEDGTDATDAIQTVAAIAANVTTVANNNANVTAVAGKATEIARLGTTDTVADMALLGTADCVADMAILGTADVVADLNTLATTAIVADLETCADNNANISTVAGSISNVNTVAGSIGDVNRYASEYFIGTTQPSSPSAGDLWYDSNTNQNTLKFYNGSSWAAISAGISNIQSDTSPSLGGTLDAAGNNMTNVGTVSGADLQIDFGSI